MLNVRRRVFGYLCACDGCILSLSLYLGCVTGSACGVCGGWWLENDVRELVRVFVSWVRLCVYNYYVYTTIRNTEKRINVCGAGGTESDVNSVI